ncbi:bifunctional UDP-2,4-diacetamido-2,4,6-trideoxy-beta-L-altropyranose hydrolase/GNAT family N-acetyltransferase [Hymenobacter sp. PAMC 26628]|uniref:bifunctional UDP-2,4-diacetamido-2,4,6-trideoxy-beta-L-altropyranose hydrolase/GNAT family N-acetyltransferase n=1 Tax=Hymenobacter sp. PAMC 26628 TaxID=1484118 RepID=UPI000770235F|nr:bifunctional UDP-2,4-diacetamido-2,4,6-trideoxy-beta-L-altropyranose hydrolase/GNAT family N-acetyltransferase [Hymenobacter sp. PAMC 26628]AMJ65857.1 hypothetical protein AXW84_10760 [Hymenobacter sp. PAMC 26628]
MTVLLPAVPVTPAGAPGRLGPRLVLRADGSPAIGLGHVVRLLALADILRSQFVETVYAVRGPIGLLQELLAGLELRVEELPEQPLTAEAEWLRQHFLRPDDVVVLDGYGFDFAYQQAVRSKARRLVCLDDLHAFPFAADAVLNPAGGVFSSSYVLRQPGARLLAGPAFTPLRAGFWQSEALAPQATSLATAADEAPGSPMVLLCLGGTDPHRRTQQVAADLLALPPAAMGQLHVVVGSAYQGWNALCAWAALQGRLVLHRALPAAGLAALMRRCGAAVLSPSTVSYEYCAVGGGLLFTLPTADNQHDLDHFLRGAGLALPYPSAANVLASPDMIRISNQLRAAQHQYFDGNAPVRLRQAFAALQLPLPGFRLRPVQTADLALLLAWANDAAVRRQSFSEGAISPATHTDWLQTRLADPNALLLLAEDGATAAPLGLIRFQLDGAVATLSYQLAAEWRGRGLSAPLLVAGTEAAQAHFAGLRRVQGHVRATNPASVRAFERAGFAAEAPAADAPAGSLTFVWIA